MGGGTEKGKKKEKKNEEVWYVGGGEKKERKKKKERGMETEERVEKKLRKIGILEVVKKINILKNRIVKLK